MKFFRFPASKTGQGYAHFEKTVLNRVPIARILKTMSPNDVNAFPATRYKALGVWALNLTSDARNLRIWEAIAAGDIATFYTDKRFTHYGPVIFKWRSETLQDTVGWVPPTRGRYSLAFAVDKLTQCDLGAVEYCALVGYARCRCTQTSTTSKRVPSSCMRLTQTFAS